MESLLLYGILWYSSGFLTCILILTILWYANIDITPDMIQNAMLISLLGPLTFVLLLWVFILGHLSVVIDSGGIRKKL